MTKAKLSRRRAAAVEDHGEAPGSYARQADGAVIRTDAPLRPAQAAAPAIPLASARATAEALAAAGAAVPAHIQAILDGEQAGPAPQVAPAVQNAAAEPETTSPAESGPAATSEPE